MTIDPIIVLVWYCAVAPKTKAYIAKVTVSEGDEIRICPETFFAPSYQDAREAALKSDRAEKERRKISREAEWIRLRAEKEIHRVLKSPPILKISIVKRMGGAWLMSGLLRDKRTYRDMGGEIGVSGACVSNQFSILSRNMSRPKYFMSLPLREVYHDRYYEVLGYDIEYARSVFEELPKPAQDALIAVAENVWSAKVLAAVAKSIIPDHAAQRTSVASAAPGSAAIR